MPVYHLTTADRNAMAQALVTAWDDQSGPATLEFYAGTIIATPATALTTQVKLGTLTASDPIAAVGNGAITFNPVAQDNAADNNGTAAFAILRDGAGNPRGVFDVTDNNGTGAIKLNTTDIKAGGPILLTNFVITLGGA